VAGQKRELINTGTDKRYVRRDEKGRSRTSSTSANPSPKIESGRRSMMQSQAKATEAIGNADPNRN
jgi:hypothetical protein